jgi:hypothetical protein
MQIDDEYDDFGEFDEDELLEFSPVPRHLTPSELKQRHAFAKEAFKDRDFLTQQGHPEPPEPQLTYAEKNEALNIFLEQPDAPVAPTTPGAAKALDKLLKRFDYTLANSTNKMRQYVLFKLFELAENEDPKLQIKAVEMLGKVSEIGLFTTKVEVAAADKPTGDLESELNELMSTYSLGGELGSIDASYAQISDEELRGDVDDIVKEYADEVVEGELINDE